MFTERSIEARNFCSYECETLSSVNQNQQADSSMISALFVFV